MAKSLPLNPLEPKGAQVTLSVWDTAGQERFNALGSAFYRGADAVIIVVDSSKPNAMDNASRWISEFKKRAPVQPGLETRRFCWLCVGAKADLREPESQAVTSEVIAKLGEILGIPATEAKPDPSPQVVGPAGSTAGDDQPAKPQDVLSRALPNAPAQALSPATPPPRSSFWGSLRGRTNSSKDLAPSAASSSIPKVRTRKSLHSLDIYHTASEAALTRAKSGGRADSDATSAYQRSRLDSTLTSTNSIYHTPRGSTILGSSVSRQGRDLSEQSRTLGSNRSSMATITPTQQEAAADSAITTGRQAGNATEEPQRAPTVIAFGDRPLEREDYLEHAMEAQDQESDMPPILSGDPIPFPTNDEFAHELPITPRAARDRLRTLSSKARMDKRVSRALTLDEVEPEEMEGEEQESMHKSAEAIDAADADTTLPPELHEGFDYVLTSSKTGLNVDFVFQHLVQRVADRWRYEEWEEQEAKREFIGNHPGLTPQEAAEVWERRNGTNGFGLHDAPMSVLERDREAIKRGIRIAAGKDPNPRSGWRSCCMG